MASQALLDESIISYFTLNSDNMVSMCIRIASTDYLGCILDLFNLLELKKKNNNKTNDKLCTVVILFCL